MSKIAIELHCQRVPKEHIYDGVIQLHSEPGVLPEQRLQFNFARKGLEQVAVWLHHMVRLVSLASKDEFCVTMHQKGSSSRPPVGVDLTAQQVQQIYESPEKAQQFFTPRHIARDGTVTSPI